MPNTVFQLRRNTVSGTRPTTTTVSTGELAINTTDGILFSANTTAIFEVGANNTNIRVTGNATINAIVANGSTGSNGQVLLSNGTGIYWGVDSINTAAQFTFSNTITFSNVITFSTANAIILPVGNTASRPPASNGVIRYNTNTGLVEVVASSTYIGLMAAYSSVREQFTASNNQTTFTVTGGYVPGAIDVYYNGVKLRNGTEVTVTSGNTFVLAAGAANNTLIEAVGTGPSFLISNTAQILYQQFTATANQTSFTVSSGYVPGLVDVFADGIRLVNGIDVNASSGTSVVLSTGVPANTIIEVKGYSTPLVSAQSSTAVRQTFTANSTVNNNFTVSGGYIPGQVDVFYNGAKLVNGSDVNTSSGTTVVLTANAVSNAIVDVVGINYFTAGGGVTTPVRQSFTATANQTSFTITGGYTSGQIDVYRNGSKLSGSGDVNITSGSAIVLASGAANGDIVEVVGFSATSYQDSVRKSGDTMTGPLVVNSSVSDSIGNVRDAPINSQTTSYQVANTDAGRTISTNSGITVNGAVLYASFNVDIFNNSAANVTITSGGGVTMHLAGTATTGNRTLAQRGFATLRCVAANTFVISGTGLT